MGLSPGLGVEVSVEWRKCWMKSGIAIQPMSTVDLFHLLERKGMVKEKASVLDGRLVMMLCFSAHSASYLWSGQDERQRQPQTL